MTLHDDSALFLHEKIALINNIEKMQKHRWARLKRFHSADHVSMRFRHYWMQKEVNLIRSQKKRLLILRQEVLG